MEPLSLLNALKRGVPIKELKNLIKPEVVNITDENGATPLSLCFKHKLGGKNHRIDVAKLLLSAGANPNVRLGPGSTLFHAACKNANVDWIKLLLSNKVDVDARDTEGQTGFHALFSATAQDKIQEIANLLIDHDAKLNAVDNYGKNVIQTALESNLPLPLLLAFLPVAPDAVDAFIYENMVKALDSNNLREILNCRGLAEASATHVLKLALSTQTDFPNDVSRLRNCQAMVRFWLLKQEKIDTTVATQLLNLGCRATIEFPGTAPLFMKNHARILQIDPTLQDDQKLFETLFDMVYTSYRTGKKELLLLLAYLNSFGSDSRDTLLWEDSDILSMPISSKGRMGAFSTVSTPAVKEEPPVQQQGNILTSTISYLTSMLGGNAKTPSLVSTSLDSVSSDILVEILLHCRFDSDLLSVASTCKSLHERIRNFRPFFWKQLMHKFRIPFADNDEKALKRAFQDELVHRCKFRDPNHFENARVIQLDRKFAGPDSICAVPSQDGLFAVLSTDGDIALLDATSNTSAYCKFWHVPEGNLYDPTFTSDGRKLFSVLSVDEEQYLCVGDTDLSREAELERHRIDVAEVSPGNMCPPFGAIQLADAAGTKLLQNPGVFYDIGNGKVKHISTLKWPEKLEATVEGANQVDSSTLLEMDRADWSAFAFHMSNPHQILAQYLYWSWLYDTRASNDPVMAFPVHRSHLVRASVLNYLDMKTEHTAWSIDKFGNLLEYDLRKPSMLNILNLVCEANQAVDPSQAESFTISPCMDTARSRIYLSYLSRTYECSIRWDLSGSVPEIGVSVSQPQKDNSLGGSALSESWLAVWRYDTNPEILMCPL